MPTLMEPIRGNRLVHLGTFVLGLLLLATSPAFAVEPLLIPLGAPSTRQLPNHLVASQRVRVNPRALQSPVISIDLMGETVVAVRDSERRDRGLKIWIGHVEGRALDRVIVTGKGKAWSALIQSGERSYQLSLGRDGLSRLDEWMLDSLPADDAAEPPSGGAVTYLSDASAIGPGATVQHDLLVVYTDGACRFSGSCGQVEADIETAVADLNAAYEASGVRVRVNIVGTAKTEYEGLDAGRALTDLAGVGDGFMDEVHHLRDTLGADLVSLVYSGAGCGIGYINASAERAFNVTDIPCLLANRTLAHEIAHNQGANHDRVSLGTPSVTTYNYGFRRCDDASLPDYAPAPHFRTIMSYSCGSVPRRGIFSSPGARFDGVPQGVDPAVAPSQGTDNARQINERAETVAAFRSSASLSAPASPNALAAVAAGPDSIGLSWVDRAIDERGYVIQAATSAGAWSTVVTLPANSESWTHNGLTAGSAWRYRVHAVNAAGASAYSAIATAATWRPAVSVDDFALADRPGLGIADGDYRSLQQTGDAPFVLTESATGRSGKKVTQAFEHAWRFDVTGGSGGVVIEVQAWVSGAEGAVFWYSTDDGASRKPMLTFNNHAPDAGQSFVLPDDLEGAVWIGVSDAEQANGEEVDSVFVDHIVIRSWEGKGGVPAAPEGLELKAVSSNAVGLAISEHSDDEWGFEVWRSAHPMADCRAALMVGAVAAADGQATFTDIDALPGEVYWYAATAFNGAGESACSDPVVVVTSEDQGLQLQVIDAYRVKGVHHVDLEWSAAMPVELYRDGFVVAEQGASERYIDITGGRGKASYQYWVCVAGTAVCSDSVKAEF